MKKSVKTVIIVLLIASLAAGAYLGFRKDKKTPEKKPAEKTEQFMPVQEPEKKEPYEGTLYIGYGDGYREIPFKSENGLSTESILENISRETGWNLDTEKTEVSDEGNVKILWSGKSSLFTGIPKEQKTEFFVAKQEDLDAMILDSVKKTVLENEKIKKIYYADSEGKDLKLPDTYVEIPADKPYSTFTDYMDYAPIY